MIPFSAMRGRCFTNQWKSIVKGPALAQLRRPDEPPPKRRAVVLDDDDGGSDAPSDGGSDDSDGPGFMP